MRASQFTRQQQNQAQQFTREIKDKVVQEALNAFGQTPFHRVSNQSVRELFGVEYGVGTLTWPTGPGKLSNEVTVAHTLPDITGITVAAIPYDTATTIVPTEAPVILWAVAANHTATTLHFQGKAESDCDATATVDFGWVALLP